MKIITWNMGYWQHTKFHDAAWGYLCEVIQPDLAFLQESKPPVLASNGTIIFTEIHNGWGTAIYSIDNDISLVEFESDYPNRVCMASLQTEKESGISLVSIHAPIIKNRVFPHLDNIVKEIERELGAESAIIAGDFNSARLAEEVWPGYGHGPFFERMDESGFVNCYWQLHSKETQTYFREGMINPFQDDHIFVSENLFDAVQRCYVMETEEAKGYSDHIPLVLEVDL